MKIMMIPAKRMLQFAEVKNFSGMWQHYMYRELTLMGHEIVFERGALPADTPEVNLAYFRDELIPKAQRVDHVLGMSRYFTRIRNDCTHLLMNSIRGAVTMIHDGPLPGALCDQVLSIRACDGVRDHTHIGWAADPDVLKPQQREDDYLRILIDHPHYHTEATDWTETITKQALALKERFPEKVSVRRFCDGGVEEITEYKPAPLFTRLHIPFNQIVDEYGKAHIFVVTHPESLGLSVLESAMAGAFVICPYGFVKQDRMDTVRGLTYQGNTVPWEEAIAQISPKASRLKAMEQSWRKVAERVVAYFEGFKRK